MDDGLDPNATVTPRDEPAGSPGGPFLVIIEDEATWRYRLPPRGTVTIGRIAVCEIKLGDPTASRKHAQLRIEDGHVFITDLGSYNGTAVNGEAVREERELHPGDLIQICSTSISFHVAEQRGAVLPSIVVDESVFHPRFAVEIERCRRFGRSLTIFAGRVDADARSRTERLATKLRAIDTIACEGKTAFLVLAPELGPDEIVDIATTIRTTVPDARLGVASCPQDGVDAATLLATARAAAAQASPGETASAQQLARRLDLGTMQIVVGDPVMMRTFALIERIATSDLPILIQGETGAGKESAAAAVHHYSRRRDKPLVTINCAAIPENLVESELFGHEKGAFTGAVASRTGLFEAADGGTIFLDEVGELPLPVQAKLLRALDTRRITKVGGTTERSIDVRIVAATNRDLPAEVKANRFREDLYFRLGGATVAVPPLRERPRDLPLLARELLVKVFARMQREPVPLSTSAMQALASYRWPGNVRELRNAMEYAAAQVDGDEIETWHLPPAIAGNVVEPEVELDMPTPAVDAKLVAAGSKRALELEASMASIFSPVQRAHRRPAESFRPIAEEIRALERKRMLQALITADGVQTRAAQLLHMPRRTFVAKMKEYAIHEELERHK